MLLSKLENGTYPLPDKSRDVYIYFPYRMLEIFPTVVLFGNLDLNTGKAERRTVFYPTRAIGNHDGILQFSNGMVFDAKKGILRIGKQKVNVKYFVLTEMKKDGAVTVEAQPYAVDSAYIVVYMKNYGRFVIMDTETFNSMYVQMFILGKYDKRYFEPVVVSPYTRIYRVKK